MSQQTLTVAHSPNQLKRGRLGATAIAFMVISAAAPLTAMAGGAPVAMLLGNGPGVPLAYVVVTILLALFAVGYTTMARFHTSTGGFYSYVARGLRPHAGGAAAWIALLGYNVMQIGLYGLFGVAASSAIAELTGITVPWWVCAYAALAIIAVLGFRQVDLSVKVLGIIVALEFLLVLVLDFAIIGQGGGGGGVPLNFDSFTMASFTSGSLAIALLFNSASYIGFEATTIYSEEAKDPARTVPRATYIAVFTIGAFYTFTSWLMVNAQGSETLVSHLAEMDDPTGFLFELGAVYVGDAMTAAMSVLFATSVFAALLAFHNAVARYLFALGREGVVPEALGRTHRVHLSPHMGSLSQTVLAILVMTLFVVTGQDPVLAQFTWLTQLGTLAILFLMAFASVAVVAFFARHPELGVSAVRGRIAPAIAAVLVVVTAVFATSQFGNLIGDPNSPLAWALPSLILVAAVVGGVSAEVLRRRDPAAFEEMGRDRGQEADVEEEDVSEPV